MYRYLLTFTLLVCLTACSNWTGDGNAVSDKVDRMAITVWLPMQSLKANALMLEQVNAFNDNQGNIQVQLTLIDPVNYSAVLKKAQQDKQLPTMICLNLNQLRVFAEDGLLQPLDKMMSQRLWQDLLPDLLEKGHIGTHIYGVPAVDKPDQELFWAVFNQAEDQAEDKVATMAFIHYLLHPKQQRSAVASGYTQPVTYSAMQ
ncbi:MAG: extracellular solute-binding protein [Gammaproteobacteria bacterium]|nr:extracellular solute-binding protein [Gammaproteobacteria bacterium]